MALQPHYSQTAGRTASRRTVTHRDSDRPSRQQDIGGAQRPSEMRSSSERREEEEQEEERSCRRKRRPLRLLMPVSV